VSVSRTVSGNFTFPYLCRFFVGFSLHLPRLQLPYFASSAFSKSRVN
jgi:hypothetical protein